MTNQKHIHHDCIVAWAKGETIEYYSKAHDLWHVTVDPRWLKDILYRVQPKPPVVRYRWVMEGVDRMLFISMGYYSEEEIKEVANVVQRIDSTRREDKE